MAAGATFYIEFPATVIVPTMMSLCIVNFNNVNYTMYCPVDLYLKTIKMLRGLTVPVPEGS